MPNGPGSATVATGRNDGNHDAPAGFAGAHGKAARSFLPKQRLDSFVGHIVRGLLPGFVGNRSVSACRQENPNDLFGSLSLASSSGSTRLSHSAVERCRTVSAA